MYDKHDNKGIKIPTVFWFTAIASNKLYFVLVMHELIKHS